MFCDSSQRNWPYFYGVVPSPRVISVSFALQFNVVLGHCNLKNREQQELRYDQGPDLAVRHRRGRQEQNGYQAKQSRESAGKGHCPDLPPSYTRQRKAYEIRWSADSTISAARRRQPTSAESSVASTSESARIRLRRASCSTRSPVGVTLI
jgi:hypothetical protein